MRVWLLGTGGPELTKDRQGAATLVEANGRLLLFDAGRGVLQRLFEVRSDIAKVSEVFLTHLHSDHIEGLPGLWMTGWFMCGRPIPLSVHGPSGTTAMLDGMQAMYGHDIVARTSVSPKINLTQINSHEFKEGTVFEADDIRVTAFEVEHCAGFPAYGFRVDANGIVLIISGDTVYTESLVRHSKGASVVIHNVIAASDEYLNRVPSKRKIFDLLSLPESCAKVFMRVKPQLAVYSHVIMLGLSEDELIARTRAAGWDGPLHVAKDRTMLDIYADGNVAVYRPGSLDDLPELSSPHLAPFHTCDPIAGFVTGLRLG
ncbi:MAG: MBL fold metallo-hydrolase [Pseudomonadota bacterium]|nr:MBL fold metallo-hydrolase [Pseudomonadota bacterium]